MAITTHGHTISTVVTSSIMGHSGGGIFPLSLYPPYQRLIKVTRETGTVNLTKSSTFLKNIGHFIMSNPLTWKYIQRLGSDGLLNAYGLTNSGVEVNALAIGRAQEQGFNVIPTFYPQFSKGRDLANKETSLACRIYEVILKNFWALEINFSCLNSKEKIRENMADALACVPYIKGGLPELCLIAKISYVHPIEFAQELVMAGVNIIHGINTIPYDIIYRGQTSPLAHVGGGGVSGGPAKNIAFSYNKGLKKILKAPLIMGCGISSLDDAKKCLEELGADCISICTAGRLNPKEAEKIILKFN